MTDLGLFKYCQLFILSCDFPALATLLHYYDAVVVGVVGDAFAVDAEGQARLFGIGNRCGVADAVGHLLAAHCHFLNLPCRGDCRGAGVSECHTYLLAGEFVEADVT